MKSRSIDPTKTIRNQAAASPEVAKGTSRTEEAGVIIPGLMLDVDAGEDLRTR